MSWQEDQDRFDETGKQPTWRSKNPLVPANYRLNLEFVCFTNAEKLARITKLRCVTGLCRQKGDTSETAWGEHCWCITKTGEIVDPYFEWKFPGATLEYKQYKDQSYHSDDGGKPACGKIIRATMPLS